MTSAASWGTTPTSPSARASARSKSSIARTNASADSARVNASRAKVRPTRFTTIGVPALELDEHRFAGPAQPRVPPIDLWIVGVGSRDERAEPLEIVDRAGQGIVLDQLDRREEHPRVQGLQEPAGEARHADLGRVGLAARAFERSGLDRFDRVAALGVRRDAAIAIGAGAVMPGREFPGRVGLPGLEERVVDRRAVAVEDAPGERDAIAPTRTQDDAAVLPQEIACEERSDRLRGRGLRHGHTPIGVARDPRNTMSQRYPSATPSMPCSRSRSAIRRLRPPLGTLWKIGSIANRGSPGKNIWVMSRCA